MKICNACAGTKPFEEFAWKNKAKGTKQSCCRSCANLASKENYKANKERHIKVVCCANKRRAKQYRLLIQNFKLTLKCNRCPENHPAVLDFHHTDPSAKEMAISCMVQKGFGLKKIQEEISKCEVLCSNCHRKHHWVTRGCDGTADMSVLETDA